MASFGDLLTKATPVLGNGIGKIGFTHLGDAGLPEEFWMRVPSAASSITQWEKIPVPRKLEPANLAFYLQCLAANEAPIAAYCTAHGVPDAIREKLQPLAMAVRAAACLFGAISTESVFGVAQVTDAPSEMVTAAAGLEISKAMLVCVLRAVNFFNTNHCTTGSTLPMGQVRLLGTIAGVGFTAEDAKDVTRVMYAAMHPVDSSYFIRSIMKYRLDRKFIPAVDSIHMVSSEVDEYLALRIRPMPAGTHAISVFAAVLRVFHNLGVLAVCPYASKLTDLAAIKDDVMREPTAYHPAATHWGQVRKNADIGWIKDALPVVARALKELAPSHSLLKSPMLAEALKENRQTQFSKFCAHIAMSNSIADFTDVKDKLAQVSGGFQTGVDLEDVQAAKAQMVELEAALDALKA